MGLLVPGDSGESGTLARRWRHSGAIITMRNCSVAGNIVRYPASQARLSKLHIVAISWENLDDDFPDSTSTGVILLKASA
jgi:hypothetical protein